MLSRFISPAHTLRALAIVTVWCVGFPAGVLAQATGSLSGRVTGPDGGPLIEAVVTVNGTSLSTTTDRLGLF